MILVNIFQVAMLGKKPNPTTLCTNTVYFLLLKITAIHKNTNLSNFMLLTVTTF